MEVMAVWKCALKVSSKEQWENLLVMSKQARRAYNIAALCLRSHDQHRKDDFARLAGEWKKSFPKEGAEYDAARARNDAEWEEYRRLRVLAKRGKCAWPPEPEPGPKVPDEMKEWVKERQEAEDKEHLDRVIEDWKRTCPEEAEEYERARAKSDPEWKEYSRLKRLAKKGKCGEPSKPDPKPKMPEELKLRLGKRLDGSLVRNLWSDVCENETVRVGGRSFPVKDAYAHIARSVIMDVVEGLHDSVLSRRDQGFCASMPGDKPEHADYPFPYFKPMYDIERKDAVECGRKVVQWTLVLDLKGRRKLRLRFFPNREGFSPDVVRSVLIGRKRGTSSWWVAFRVDVPVESVPLERRTLGVDLNCGEGNTVVVATTDKELYRRSVPGSLEKMQRRLEALQAEKNRILNENGERYGTIRVRKLSRMIRRMHERMADARENALHHFSKELVLSGDTVALEDLDLAKMTKSAKGTVRNPGKDVKKEASLNRRMLGVAAGRFREMVKYKSDRLEGSRVVLVEPAWSSQKCCYCGAKGKRDGRTFVCTNPACAHFGEVRDADANAAMNHVREAEARRGKVVESKAGKETKIEAMQGARARKLAAKAAASEPLVVPAEAPEPMAVAV